VTAERCTYEGAGTPCRPGKCADDLADLAAFCQGNGSCAPLQQQSCDPVGCNPAGTQCAGPCHSDGDCSADQYCSAGLCVAKLADGTTCGDPAQCANGNCVDGLCCDVACDGACEACDQVGHIGTCTPVAGAPRSGRTACLGSGACGGFCGGTNGDQCTLPGLSVVCGAAFCDNASATAAPACNGNATCVVPAPRACDPYQCDTDGKSCLTSCEVDEDCAAGLVCNAGDCSTPLPDGGVDAGSGNTGAGGRARGNGGADSGTAPRGSGGRAGNSGEGGRVNAGGATGTGGAAGNAMNGRDAGVIADAGPASPDGGSTRGPGSHDSGGCGCRVTNSSSDGEVALVLFAALGLVLGRRRRARAEAA
jgi:hypothetical protein